MVPVPPKPVYPVHPLEYAEPVPPEPAYPEPAYLEPAYPDEPAVYNYAYAVADEYSGTKLNAKENRDEYKTSGSYQVLSYVLPAPIRYLHSSGTY